MKLGSSSPMWGTEIQKPSLWQVHISSWPVLWNPNGSEYWAPSVHLSDCQFFGHRDLPTRDYIFKISKSSTQTVYRKKLYIYMYIDSKILKVSQSTELEITGFPMISMISLSIFVGNPKKIGSCFQDVIDVVSCTISRCPTFQSILVLL